MNIQTQKKQLIAKINIIEDAYLLLRVEKFLQEEIQQENRKSKDWLSLAQQPTPKYIDLEELAIQQNYNGERLSQRLGNVNERLWKGENVSELLACLKN